MFKQNTLYKGQPRILTIKLPPTGEQTVDVRWPTDNEWCKRTSSLRMIQRQIGVGKSKTEGLNGIEVNYELFRKIALDSNGNNSSDAIDKPTASWVIDQLERCDILEVERAQGIFAVRLGIRGGVVCHFIDGNKLKQDKIVEYNRRRIDVYRNGNVIESKTYLEPAGILYDACAIPDQKPEGYAGAVPIIHKAIVVEAVLEEIDRVLSEYQNDPDDDDEDDDRDNPDDQDDDGAITGATRGELQASGRPSLTGSGNGKVQQMDLVSGIRY